MRTNTVASLSRTSYSAILAQIKALEQQALAIRAKEVAGVIAKAKDAIAHYGITAADLGFGGPTRPGPKSRASPGPNLGPRAVKAKKGAIKFRDQAGNTWVGMGKRPRWFVEALASGKTPEDLLVKG